MDELVTSSTPDNNNALRGRGHVDEEEEDEITAMQRSIQEDLPPEEEGSVKRASIDSVEEIRQYIVYVQDDGTILLDKKGIMPDDADPARVIPLRLPVNKLADPDDPLPGAVHISYRQAKQDMGEKAELKTLLYNANTDEVIGGANRLEEHDLEWVQINPTVNGDDIQVIPVPETIQKEKVQPKLPEPQPTPAPAATPAPVPETPPVPKSEPPKPTVQNTSARARRSLRQADRAEKQEAERILAENQQMLQREKEQMENIAKSPASTAKPPANTVTPSGHIVAISPAAVKKEKMVEVEKDEVDDPTKKNPKRARKLPAHLTDPNYIHPLDLEDEQSQDVKEVTEEAEEDEEEEEGDEDVDDPNKLWCICRRPHNNRFMIQCDSCDDWFHGKCVGVTKAQGKVIEESEMQWHCPACKKKLKEQDARNRLSDKKGKSAAKTAEGTKSSRPSDKASARDRKDQPDRRSSNLSPDSTDISKKGSSSSTAKNEDPSKKKTPRSETKCIVCGNMARDGSVFCSNKCVMEKAKTNVPEAQPKKELAKKDSAGDSFLSFHKIMPTKKEEGGVVSSTTEKSAKPQLGKPESHDESATPKVSKPSALSKATIPQKPSDSDPRKSMSDPRKKIDDSQKLRKKLESPGKPQSNSGSGKPKEVDSKGTSNKPLLQKQKSVEERNSQSQKPQTQQKIGDSKQQQRDPNKKIADSSNKTRDPSQTSSKSGQLVRSTSKDESRSKDKDWEEQKLKRTSSSSEQRQKPKTETPRSSQQRSSLERKKSDTPSSLNSEPLLRQNMKRSFQAILEEKLKEAKAADPTVEFKAAPEVLAKEIEQELISCFGTAGNPKCKSKFRSLLFNLRNTRSTLATNLLTLSLPPSQLVRMDSTEMAPAELTEWRQRESKRELEAIKRSELEKLTEAKKQELLEKGAEMDVVGKVAVVARQELEGVIPEPEGKTDAKTSDEKKKEERDKIKQSKKKKHHRDRDRHHRGESSSAHDKKPEKTEDKSLKRSSSVLEEEPKAVWPELPIKEKYDVPFPLTSPRELSPGLPELPSSTVKTPDFSPPQTTSLSPLLKTKLMMPELGSLNASLFHVSHPYLDGNFFPDSPVPIVGRIAPETVWDYIDKMKKSKELIVLRLAPASPQDADAYMTFFSYLASRGRLGVLGGISPPLKDVYLVPLDKHSPVNRCLLPFHGPGLPTERAHCLLAVVTRTIDSGHRPRIDIRHAKKPRIEPKPEPLPSLNKEDEDKPYEPEDEDEEDEMIEAPIEEDKVALKLREVNEQIAKQRQEIESILVATSRNEDLARSGGIPGLDGEFEGAESEIIKSTPDVIEVLKPAKETETIEIIDKHEPTENVTAEELMKNVTAEEEPMEIDESSPSPVTIMDTPPTPEAALPGLDEFRPLKKQPVEELSDEIFAGSSLKQPFGKKIEINIKGSFTTPAPEQQTSHGDIDERQQPIMDASSKISLSANQSQQQPASALPPPPLVEIPLPPPPPLEQPKLPIDVSVPPPTSFFMTPGLPPVGLPPPPSHLGPGYSGIPMGGRTPPMPDFSMASQHQPTATQPPRFPSVFPPSTTTMSGSISPATLGADFLSPTSSSRADRFHTGSPNMDGRRGDGQRVSRNISEDWDDGPVPRNAPDRGRRIESPRFRGRGDYRHLRGNFQGRVSRNPGGDRGQRWEDGQRRYNRDRERSPDRRDRSRRDSPDTRHRRRRTRTPSPRRRSRSPSPRRRSRTPSPRRRHGSQSPRRKSRSASPAHKSKSSSPRKKSASRSRSRSSSSSSSSSSEDSSKSK